MQTISQPYDVQRQDMHGCNSARVWLPAPRTELYRAGVFPPAAIVARDMITRWISDVPSHMIV